jgi:hypothetical protein
MTSSKIDEFNKKIETLLQNCMKLETEAELKELFKDVVIMFIKDSIKLHNKLIQQDPSLKFTEGSEKFSKLNILVSSLESDGKLFNIDCNELIFKGYFGHIYAKYREYMMNWNIEGMKHINENIDTIQNVILESAKKEQVADSTYEHMNIIPELVMMINKLSEKEILKLLYLLNNLNTIMDVYVYKYQNN